MEEKFIEFLKGINALTKFKNNMGKYRSTEDPHFANIDEFLDSTENPDEYVISGFVWGKTPEGVDFWDKLDDKWQDVVQGKQSKETKELKFSLEYDDDLDNAIGKINKCLHKVGFYIDYDDCDDEEKVDGIVEYVIKPLT